MPRQHTGFLGFSPWAWVGIVALAVIFAGISSGGDDSSADEMVPLRGSVTVYDQRVCASGPMIRVSAGARGPMPLEYEKANAPCKMLIDDEIPKASRYTFEIKPLAPVVVTPAADGSVTVDLVMTS